MFKPTAFLDTSDNPIVSLVGDIYNQETYKRMSNVPVYKSKKLETTK